MAKKALLVGITGASGSIYALRFLQRLVEMDQPVEVIFSEVGKRVFEYETGICVEEVSKLSRKTYEPSDFFSPPASGSSPYLGMVIIPCSMGTLSAIASGSSLNLIHRAADVMLKERKPLILVVRETPLNLIHLENMLKVARAGGIIYPAMPSFYAKPKNLDELIDQFVERLVQFLFAQENPYSWERLLKEKE